MLYESMFEADYFSKGLAVAEARILTDTYYFRFRNEEFEFPSNDVFALVTHHRNAFSYAPVKELRKMVDNNKKNDNGLRRER